MTATSTNHLYKVNGQLNKMRLWLGVITLLLAACGMTDDKTINENITPPSAGTPRLDAQFRSARVPASFVPINAIKGHTTWGAMYLSYSAGYTAPARDVQAFLDATHAQSDLVAYRSADDCGPIPSGGQETTTPTAFVKLWIDKGILDRCATIESWHVPSSELTNDRATAGLYRLLPPPGPDGQRPTNVVVSVAYPASSRS